MKKPLALLLALILVLGLAACGGGSTAANGGKSSSPALAEYTVTEAYPAEAADFGYMEASESKAESSLPQYGADVKMVYRANLELESTEFEQAASDIDTLVEQLGGYLEEQSVRNYSNGYRYATYTVRVPADKFKAFLSQIGGLCHVVYQTQSAENITERYYDTDSRLKTAQTKLERLQDLLAKADNMADIITLEGAISDTEYEIESLSGTLRHYDALVGYSTISVELREVYRLTEVEEAPVTFPQRMAAAFKDGLASFSEALEDLAVWFAYHWTGVLVAAVVVILIVRLIRKKGKVVRPFRRKKSAPPTDDSGEEK